MLCGYWLAFSAVITVFIGWGTNENGLMLYGLYFGWAYFALLFQLVEWIAEKMEKTWILPLCTLIMMIVMLTVNIPEMKAMIDFAVTYYPG